MEYTKLNITEKPYIVNRPEHKFETVLFLPEGEGRKGEGGLRTKGYFKHSYKLDKDNGVWYICDTENNPVKPAPDDIQKKIKDYLSSLPDGESITELPLISVITVVLNGEKYLEETIQSVINQTYPNVEYIIIDGGSTDGTIDIIKKYEDYIDYWVSEKDKGIYDAMNKGLKVLLGSHSIFINSGDKFVHQYSLNELFNFIFLNGLEKSYVFQIRKNGNVFPLNLIKMSIYQICDKLGQQNFCIKSSVFKKIGLFNTSFDIAGDREFNIRSFLVYRQPLVKFEADLVFFDSSGISSKIDLKSNLIGHFERQLAYLKNGIWSSKKLFRFLMVLGKVYFRYIFRSRLKFK